MITGGFFIFLKKFFDEFRRTFFKLFTVNSNGWLLLLMV